MGVKRYYEVLLKGFAYVTWKQLKIALPFSASCYWFKRFKELLFPPKHDRYILYITYTLSTQRNVGQGQTEEEICAWLVVEISWKGYWSRADAKKIQHIMGLSRDLSSYISESFLPVYSFSVVNSISKFESAIAQRLSGKLR